jgi:hypothetical protein
MNTASPMVSFYVPPKSWPDPFPEIADRAWPGYKLGLYAWTIQTYSILVSHGYPCQIINRLQGVEGIIIAHRDCLEGLAPAFNQLFVCIQADWGRHPYAQVHICQNPTQVQLKGKSLFYKCFWPGKTYFVRHWPEGGLIPRNTQRPERLQTLAYYGREQNLAEELRGKPWADYMLSLGLDWRINDEDDQWHDYSDLDAVVLVRDFHGHTHDIKPATKLFNACLAGCVPICGYESATLYEVGADPNAIVVKTLAELKEQVKRLSQSPEHYHRARAYAVSKAPRYSQHAIVSEWIDILEHLKTDEWPRWQNNRPQHRCFLMVRIIASTIKKNLDLWR